MLLESIDRLVYGILGFDPSSRLGGTVSFFLYDTIKIFLLLAGMIFVIGVIRSYIPQRKLRGWMSGGGLWGNLFAALFGALTPFCSCSSIPLFIGFLKAGVPLGVAFSFLITSPIVNEYLVVLMTAEFGFPIAAAYLVLGLAIGIGAGAFLGRLGLERYLEPEFSGEDPEDSPESWSGFGARLRFGWSEAASVLRAIWAWVLVGVGIGAVIHNYVPRETIHGWMDAAGAFSVPLATVIGVPLYGNCAAIVPVAVVLFEKGIPLGTALAFMMAMAALSVPEAVMLRRTMRLPLIAIFFGTTGLAIVVTGYVFNFLPLG